MKYLFVTGAFFFCVYSLASARESLPCQGEALSTGGDVAKKVQYFNSIVGNMIDSLSWYCDPKTRSIYLAHGSTKIHSDYYVQNYFTAKDCHEDADKLNDLVPRISDQDGKITEHLLLVCIRNEYFLVKQTTPLDKVKEQGVPLHNAFAQSSSDCVELPRKFLGAIGYGKSLKLVTNKKRVDEANKMIVKHQREFLKKNFNYDLK